MLWFGLLYAAFVGAIILAELRYRARPPTDFAHARRGLQFAPKFRAAARVDAWIDDNLDPVAAISERLATLGLVEVGADEDRIVFRRAYRRNSPRVDVCLPVRRTRTIAIVVRYPSAAPIDRGLLYDLTATVVRRLELPSEDVAADIARLAPPPLGRRLRRFAIGIAITALAGLVTIGGCVVTGAHGVRSQLRDNDLGPMLESIANDGRRFYPVWKADLEDIRSWYRPPTETPTRDAAPYLHPRMAWDGADDWLAEVPPDIRGSLALPHALRYGQFATPWTSTVLTDDMLEQLDFSWFEDIKQYDFWETTNAAPPSVRVPLIDRPFMIYVQLAQWSAYRLLAGQQTGTLRKAIEDVRHLAYLLLTTEDYIAVVIAASIYEYAATAAQTFDPNGADVRPTVEQARRLRRATTASIVYLSHSVPRDLFERAASDAIGTPMLCVGATHASETAVPVATFLAETAALGPGIDRVRSLATAPEHGCRWTMSRRFWAAAELDWLDLNLGANTDEPLFPGQWIAHWVPALREALAYWYVMLVQPAGFRRYAAPEEAVAPHP